MVNVWLLLIEGVGNVEDIYNHNLLNKVLKPIDKQILCD